MSIFSLYWNIGNYDGNTEFAIRRNIKKNILFPRYHGRFGGFDAPLAYVGSKEINPESNLSIIATEDSINENSRFPYLGSSEFFGNVGYVFAQYFLLTDVVGDYVSESSEPFFYKHVLPSADIDPDSVAILDENLQAVADNSYRTIRTEARDSSDIIVTGSYEDCSVFSNYKNSYDSSNNVSEIYFVRYKIDGTSHYSILNQQPAFSVGTPGDVSTITGQLKTWRKIYILDTSTTPFTLTTPDGFKTYYIKLSEESRIVARAPVERDDSDPWFLNISNGSFSADRSGYSYNYSVPEFSSQSFSPLYPYKLQVNEKAQHIKPNILKVDRQNLNIDTSMYSLDILIKDSKDNILYALTTDSSKDGTYYTENGQRVYRTIETDNEWVTWNSSRIASYDEYYGFIHLDRNYPSINYFYVTYYYEEKGYDFTSLNINPLFDNSYNGEFYILYTVPIGGENDNSSRTQSLFYLKVDTSGRVIEVSQDGTAGNYNLSAKYTDETQYMYYSKSVSSVSTIDNLIGWNYITLPDATDWPANGIVAWETEPGKYEYRAYDNIIQNSLIFENPLNPLLSILSSGTTFGLYSFKDFFSSDESNSYQWLILAEAGVQTSSKVRDLSVLDIRKPGGYIQEKYWDLSEKMDPRAIWARPYISLNNGQVIPGDSASVIKVPYTLLQEYGGNFTRDDIENIVTNRHLATGILPVIIYHGAIPEITSITPTTDAVTVCWWSEGSDYSYKIYYSATSDGPWTLASTVASSAYGYCYTITGLTQGVVYYISISAVSSDGIEGPRGTVWGTRTRRS